ncbi:helix-turn-helix domain-containing protein [Rothia nasimurium]|uniref:helix-turn-helix transcriptional regulator n=1 Tax=Rothia nasimurium TaxID=85336 RepID=UPI002DD65252|nr:helix-turn-helix domain-containing protein [Rothia nasimurium]
MTVQDLATRLTSGVEEDPILTLQELAAREKVSVNTVRQWRMRGEDPRSFIAGGRYVRYRLSDVLAWEEERMSGRAA